MPSFRLTVAAFLLLVLSLIGPVQICKAQYGAAFFQTFVPDPRTQALGEATVALRGYAGALSINPATIGRSGVVQLSTNVGLRAADPGIIESAWLPHSPVDLGISNPTLDGRLGRGLSIQKFQFWRN
ncbi:MAG TPA: hypothetical protein VKP65_05610 [Rhodothermales bacterium]|nr:hypothetical protein [Rhodothermales bacterium]